MNSAITVTRAQFKDTVSYRARCGVDFRDTVELCQGTWHAFYARLGEDVLVRRFDSRDAALAFLVDFAGIAIAGPTQA